MLTKAKKIIQVTLRSCVLTNSRRNVSIYETYPYGIPYGIVVVMGTNICQR